jgi:predicted ATPase
MLQKVCVKGYRALKDFEIDLPAGRPLVLIGENATGKSTILDALSMICAVASGRAGRAILQRGGWAAVSWAGASADIEMTVRFSEQSPIFRKGGAPVEYMVRLGAVRSGPTILDEEVRIYKQGLDQRPFIALKGGTGRWANKRPDKSQRSGGAGCLGRNRDRLRARRDLRRGPVPDADAGEGGSPVDRVLPVVRARSP